MRDFTEEEVLPFAELARAQALPGALHRVHAARRGRRLVARTGCCTGAEIRAMIDRVYPLEPVAARAARDRARSGASATARGEIGFINPVSEPFCADCNRIRLTAEGKLRTCLFSLHETDLREPLRAGAERRRARADRSATPSGARSSSTTSPSRASASRRAR